MTTGSESTVYDGQGTGTRFEKVHMWRRTPSYVTTLSERGTHLSDHGEHVSIDQGTWSIHQRR